MHQHDRGSDLVEQRHHGVARDRLLPGEVHLGQEAADHLQANRIVRLAGPGPLGVQMRLRPELVLRLLQIAPLRAFAVGEPLRAVHFRHMARAPAARLVDGVDRVAAAREILRPAFAPVRRAGEGRARAGTAVHHHDRIGMRLLLRDAHLDVHLADHVGLAVDGRALAADREEAVAREVERRIILVGGLRGTRGQERENAAGEQRGGADRDQRNRALIHGFFLRVTRSYRMVAAARNVPLPSLPACGGG